MTYHVLCALSGLAALELENGMSTLNDACERFLSHCESEKRLSPLTLRAYAGDLRCFLAVAGADNLLTQFSESWIESAVKVWSQDDTLKAITVRRRVACVKAMVRWLFRKKLISFNPLERIHIEIRIPKRLPRNLHTDEIRRLIADKPETLTGIDKQAHGSSISRSNWDILTARLAIEVLTLTGLRVGELVKVRRADLDLRLGQIRVSGKGNRERHVSFPDNITTIRLQTYQKLAEEKFAQSNSDGLFYNGLGKLVNEQYLRRVIRHYAEDADLTRRVTPHMLRHTAATQLLEAGLDIRLVQRLLGHASITTTEIYTHVADHVLRSEIARANVRGRLEME